MQQAAAVRHLTTGTGQTSCVMQPVIRHMAGLREYPPKPYSVQPAHTSRQARLPAAIPQLGFGGLGFAHALLQTLGTAVTTAGQFFLAFDFLVSHVSLPLWNENGRLGKFLGKVQRFAISRRTIA